MAEARGMVLQVRQGMWAPQPASPLNCFARRFLPTGDSLPVSSSGMI